MLSFTSQALLFSQICATPPSTKSSIPETSLAWSEEETTFAISSGSPIRLRSLSNGARIGDLPARPGTAKARFGTFPHSFDVVVFSALGCTSITDIRADAAKLMRKPRIPREQNCAITTYWRALVAKTDGFCHRGRIMCKAFIDTR
jgi:hypothetical protein